MECLGLRWQPCGQQLTELQVFANNWIGCLGSENIRKFLQSITEPQTPTSPSYCLACSSTSVMVVHRTDISDEGEGGCKCDTSVDGIC